MNNSQTVLKDDLSADLMSDCVCKRVDTEWSTSRKWYNDRVMDTYISAPIVDKQGDMIPTETLKESMDFYMKHGIYSYKHDEIPIGQPLAWKVKDGKVLLRVGIHNKLDMHNKVWKEIQEYGSKGASSIRGEAMNQNQVCPPNESCFTKIDKLGLWSVSWVGDSPANPEATVQSVSMAKEEENIGNNVSENELESNSHIKKCGNCSKPVEKCGSCNKPVNNLEKKGEAREMFQGLSDLMGTTSPLTKASKIYTSVGRMVTDVTMEISRNDRTPLGNKTRQQLGRLMQSLAQMEKNLETVVASHRTIIEEMDKGYKAVEGLKMDMRR